MFAFWVIMTMLLIQFTFLIRTLSLAHPTTMLCLAVLFTAFACNSWRTTTACILGVAVYIAGWIAHKAWQPTTLNLFAIKGICTAGVGIWCYGIYQTFQKRWSENSTDRHLS